MIRHVLLLKINDSVKASQITVLQMLFETLPQRIAAVTSVEWGENDSLENKHQGYTHCVNMTFNNEEGRRCYLPHPAHSALKKVLRPLIDDILVFDYQCENTNV